MALFANKKYMSANISVVVPVYKGENYLEECIDSILNQSFQNIELILVDDGSPDNSGAICDDYAARDSRVKVIHKNNEGINKTRLRGVMEACGEWIAFCDNDDSMPLDALESLYALTESTDIVIGFPDAPNYHRDLTLEECRRNMITSKLLPPSPWGKLYRRELLTEDVFSFPREIDGEEDMIMNIRLMFKVVRAPRICFKKVYNFRRNTASVSHTKRASLEHEMAFDQARARSIPAEHIGDYMHEIIRSKINGLTPIAYQSPQVIAAWNHTYLKQIQDEVTTYGYKPNIREWLILHVKNAGLLKMCCLLIMVKHSLQYRLGLNN